MLDRFDPDRFGMTNTDKTFSPLNWVSIAEQIDQRGFVRLERLLNPDQCVELQNGYDDASQYRSRIVMQRHSFGQGEYQYFAYPLPALVGRLREQLYASLAPIANVWHERLSISQRFPSTLTELSRICHDQGQRRPTPLILKYGAGDYNRLHQDLYGEFVFPMQLTVMLSQPTTDFGGGEFVLTEQRPRTQSRVQVVPLAQGDAVIFAVNERPVRGARGWSRAKMRHGVSEITRGERFTLGLIFHDAN